jgi:hypothetical protein
MRTAVVLMTIACSSHADIIGFCKKIFLGMSNSATITEPSKPPSDWVQVQGNFIYKGMIVTGVVNYPEKLVFSNLGILPNRDANYNLEYFNIFKNKNILSLGEGYNTIALSLRKNGFQATAVDLWYAHPETIPDKDDYRREITPKTILEEYKKFPGSIVAADARKLPFANESQGVVLSHNLVNNLTVADQKRVMMESIRVLQANGEARHFGFENEEQTKSMVQFLEKTYGSSLEISSESKTEEIFHTVYGRQEVTAYLIKMIKKEKTPDTVEVTFLPEEELKEKPKTKFDFQKAPANPYRPKGGPPPGFTIRE